MRTRALSNKLSRLEARFPLRLAKRDDKSYPSTIEERCSGMSYLLRRMEPWNRLSPDIDRAIAEFEEAWQQRPVPEALTRRTWEMLTGVTTPLLQAWGFDVGPSCASDEQLI